MYIYSLELFIHGVRGWEALLHGQTLLERPSLGQGQPGGSLTSSFLTRIFHTSYTPRETLMHIGWPVLTLPAPNWPPSCAAAWGPCSSLCQTSATAPQMHAGGCNPDCISPAPAILPRATASRLSAPACFPSECALLALFCMAGGWGLWPFCRRPCAVSGMTVVSIAGGWGLGPFCGRPCAVSGMPVVSIAGGCGLPKRTRLREDTKPSMSCQMLVGSIQSTAASTKAAVCIRHARCTSLPDADRHPREHGRIHLGCSLRMRVQEFAKIGGLHMIRLMQRSKARV